MASRDFKYREFVETDLEWEASMTAAGSIQSDCLKPCALAFRENMMRSKIFQWMPSEMAFQTARNNLFQFNAYIAVSGKKQITVDEWHGMNMAPDMVLHFLKQAGEYERNSKEYKTQLGQAVGILETEFHLEKNQGMQASMDAMFTAITLEAWIFFEALVSDLWVAAVDHGTKGISNRVGLFNEWNKPEEGIKMHKVMEMQHNWKDSPGSFLREAGKVSFTKLRDIRKFYVAAFGDAVKPIIDNEDGGYIHALNGVRNCVAHYAGRVDPDFKRKMERFPEFNALNLNDPILLDGSLVNRLRNTATKTGVALLNYVDALLLSGV